MEIKTRRNRTIFSAALSVLDLLYHSVVREVRTQSGNASLGLLIAVAQNIMLVAVFYVMYTIMGLRGLAIRGDFVLFLLTGIFLFLTHNAAIQSVMKASGPTDTMMLHGPMNTMISILASAFSGLYLQVFAIAVILFATYVIRGNLELYEPSRLFLPFLFSWLSGFAIGLLFLSLKPFAPKFIPMLAMLYRRANLITSGKMLPANLMSIQMVSWFDWNPLFHTIDQSRGAAFVNYTPRNSNLEYPIIFTIVCIMVGLMIEFWLRKNMSQSWGKRSKL